MNIVASANQKLLVINASPRGTESLSRKAAKMTVDKILESHPSTEVTHLDLQQVQPPHVSMDLIGAFYTPDEKKSPQQKELTQLSDQLVDQALAADYILISTPMWNFGLPSVLKAYIDHISRAGKTFKFTEEGLVGLLKAKKVIVVVASGSVFSEGPMQSLDQVTPYLKTVFGFMGVQNVEVIRAEGLNDPKAVSQAFLKTERQIGELVLH